MAGAGYKLFNTGDVLLASEVNTYLMQQTVMVFANATARTSALSGVLAEGMLSYLADTNATEVYDGSSWVSVSGTGDITAVTAGTGLTGGGTTGAVTLTNDMATTITAAGDIVVGTGNGTYDNLPIGTTGQVLTADTTVSPYKVKWAAAAGGGANWSIVNSGGTALTAAGSITISGITGADKLMIMVDQASSSSAGQEIQFRFNSDTGSNYSYYGMEIVGASTYAASNLRTRQATNNTAFSWSEMSGSAGCVISGYVLLSGGDAAGVKVFNSAATGDAAGSNSQQGRILGGFWNNSATITSVTIFTGGNFDAGTIYVYKSA